MIRCRYRIFCDDIEGARVIARCAAVEQTVEVPDSLIDDEIEEGIVGKVLSVDEVGCGVYGAEISFRDEFWVISGS